MPNWSQILGEIGTAGSVHDVVRRRYLRALGKLTGRNVIVYYSGWLQNPRIPGVVISDEDKNGFMTVIHEMDRKRGLDLLLHTPGRRDGSYGVSRRLLEGVFRQGHTCSRSAARDVRGNDDRLRL